MSLSNITNSLDLIPNSFASSVATVNLGVGTISTITSTDATLTVTNSSGPTVSIVANGVPPAFIYCYRLNTSPAQSSLAGSETIVSNLVLGQQTTGAYSFNGTTITPSISGSYKVSYCLTLQNTTGGAFDNVTGYIKLNGIVSNASITNYGTLATNEVVNLNGSTTNYLTPSDGIQLCFKSVTGAYSLNENFPITICLASIVVQLVA